EVLAPTYGLLAPSPRCSRTEGIGSIECDFNAQSTQFHSEDLVIVSQNRSDGTGVAIVGHGYVPLWVDCGPFQLPLADFNEKLLTTHLARDPLQNEQGSRQPKRNCHEAGDYDAGSLGRGYLNLLSF